MLQYCILGCLGELRARGGLVGEGGGLNMRLRFAHSLRDASFVVPANSTNFLLIALPWYCTTSSQRRRWQTELVMFKHLNKFELVLLAWSSVAGALAGAAYLQHKVAYNLEKIVIVYKVGNPSSSTT